MTVFVISFKKEVDRLRMFPVTIKSCCTYRVRVLAHGDGGARVPIPSCRLLLGGAATAGDCCADGSFSRRRHSNLSIHTSQITCH